MDESQWLLSAAAMLTRDCCREGRLAAASFGLRLPAPSNRSKSVIEETTSSTVHCCAAAPASPTTTSNKAIRFAQRSSRLAFESFIDVIDLTFTLTAMAQRANSLGGCRSGEQGEGGMRSPFRQPLAAGKRLWSIGRVSGGAFA